MRRPIIAGNWKMNGTRAEARVLIDALLECLPTPTNAEVVVCPPFTALGAVSTLLQGASIGLGAQDLFWKDKGAYTGQISAPMLVELGVTHVIVGHSERRGRFGIPEPDFDERALAVFGDNDHTVNRKLRAALAAGLKPICCVGETLAERHSDATDEVICAQVQAALADVNSNSAATIVFAYEPVWAIGTGEVCAAEEADRVCELIRRTAADAFDSDVTELIRVQYGGSVKPDNAADILSRPNIDGALVGGASLKAADFAAIVLAT